MAADTQDRTTRRCQQWLDLASVLAASLRVIAYTTPDQNKRIRTTDQNNGPEQ
jgi:hypothetical protein